MPPMKDDDSAPTANVTTSHLSLLQMWQGPSGALVVRACYRNAKGGPEGDGADVYLELDGLDLGAIVAELYGRADRRSVAGDVADAGDEEPPESLRSDRRDDFVAAGRLWGTVRAECEDVLARALADGEWPKGRA